MKNIKPPTIAIEEIKRNSGKKYRLCVRYTNQEGKRVRERRVLADTKARANQIKTKIVNEFYNNNYSLDEVEKTPYSLDQLVQEYLAHIDRNVAPRTKTTYTNHFGKLKDFISTNFPSCFIDVTKIESKHMTACINYYKDKKVDKKEKSLEKKWSDRTVNNFLVNIKSLFNYASKKAYIFKSPLMDIHKKRLPSKGRAEYYTNEELKTIYQSIDKNYKNAVEFIVNTGLRKGELIHLLWSNVSVKEKQPFIEIKSSELWQTKTRNSRIVPLNKKALSIIEKERGKNVEYVFTSPTGQKLHPDRFLEALKKVLLAKGISGDIHKLRHTFASKLAMEGESLLTIAELLGHSETETTKLYAHLSPDHKQKAVDKIK